MGSLPPLMVAENPWDLPAKRAAEVGLMLMDGVQYLLLTSHCPEAHRVASQTHWCWLLHVW